MSDVERERQKPNGHWLVNVTEAARYDDDTLPPLLETIADPVTQQHEGKGLGRILLQSGIDRARFLGNKRLFVETNSRLAAAVSLYRELGFVDLPRSVWPPSEHGRVDLVMELRL